MAGLRGNEAWLMFAKQASKGTLATTAVATTHKVPFTGGNIGPVRETDTLAETDSSRDAAAPYVVTSGVEGSPEVAVRDSSIGALLLGVLGADAVSGTMPNYTHVITPSNTLPYFSFWKMLSSTLYESYRDCQISSLTISAEAGAPLTASIGVQGLVPARLTTDPSTTPAIPLASSALYNFNEAAVTLGGGATSLIRSFELTIENNVSRQQTDDVVPYDVTPGVREVSLSFDMIFETLDEYNKFHYGGAAGTSVATNIFTTAATFTFTKSATNEIAFNLPNIAYTELSPEPDPGGDPIVVSVSAVAVRGGSPVVTATVKNQVAAY
jgi:Phage tail tube protein